MAKLNKTPLTIRSKRGTEAEITSYTGYQLSGEIAYATDTKDFYVSDGSQFNKIASFPFTGSAQIQGLGTTSATTALRIEDANASASFIVRDDGRVGVGCTDLDTIFETQGSIRVRHPSVASRKLVIGWGAIYPLSDTDEFAFLNGGAQKSGMRFYGRFHSSSPSIGNLFSETGISIGKTLAQLPDSNTHVHVTGSDSDQTLFKVSNPSNPSLFSISGSGNVGIGSTNPTEKLTVEGNISASGDLAIQGFPSVSASLASSGGGGSAFPFTGSAQIQGLGTTSATTALKVENANASSSFEVLDDGRVKLPTDVRIYTNTTPFIHNGNSSLTYPNVFIGNNAGNFTSTGTGRNVGIGQNALQDLTTGLQNTGIGWNAGKEITEGSSNTFIGAGAGQSVTTGDNNFGIGAGCLPSITTDSFNVGIGTNVFYNLTSGTGNIGIGYQVFNNLIDGDHNIGMGTQAGRFNQGTRNVSIGYYTLVVRASGSYNTIVGYQALQNNTEDNNVAIGYQAGRSANAGGTNDTGSNSVFLGYQAYPSDKNDTNEIVIGYQAVGLGSNTAVLGNDNIVTTALKGNVGIGTTSPTEKLTIEGNISASGDLAIQGFPSVSASLASSGGGGSAFPFTGSAQIQGSGTTSATSALKIENATPTTIFDLKDNGQFTVGPSNSSISIASSGRVTIAASAPDLSIGGGNYLDFPGGGGTIDGVRTVNRTGEIRINATQGTRFGNTSLSAGTRVSIVGDNNTTPFGIRQTPGGTTNNILATFISGSGDVVMGITADGGFTATDSTLVKRYVFEHGYAPSPADGMGIGLDLKVENASGTITSVGFIDVIQDDVSADENSMRISVGETTPTEVMRLESSGNVGIGNTSPDASAILDIASTSKGVVFPRMTSSQRTAISSPTTGLIVYQTDATEGLYIYKSTGWVQII